MDIRAEVFLRGGFLRGEIRRARDRERGGRGFRRRDRGRDVAESRTPNLQLGAVVHERRAAGHHPFAIDVRAGLGAEVVDEQAARFNEDARVLARDGVIIEDDGAAGGAADGELGQVDGVLTGWAIRHRELESAVLHAENPVLPAAMAGEAEGYRRAAAGSTIWKGGIRSKAGIN